MRKVVFDIQVTIFKILWKLCKLIALKHKLKLKLVRQILFVKPVTVNCEEINVSFYRLKEIYGLKEFALREKLKIA